MRGRWIEEVKMTRDEILQLAIEADLVEQRDIVNDVCKLPDCYVESIERFAVLVAAHFKAVGQVRTIGGYPDESAHVAEWSGRFRDLEQGETLYVFRKTRTQE